MSDGYQILDLATVESFPYHQRNGQKLLPIQQLLDYRVAGINGWIGDPGEPLVPKHAEDSDNEELYVVVRGHATFTIDGREIDAPEGTLLHLQPGEEREAVSKAPGTIIVAIGATIGQAYEPQGWTSFVMADHYRRVGRIDEGRAAIRAMIAAHPGAWHAPYNAACYEALAGDADAAFELLQQAQQIDTQGVRKFAAGDSDLESLHDDPRWKKVVG
ncbi:MAG TPA: AraC family ligand binding domain-containing protein [Gaiellaceae bacterium]|nr:AraC family ligand binding domain-containing protein [Gaiellaceae bacterium]